LLEAVGLERRARDVGPTLSEYLAKLREARPTQGPRRRSTMATPTAEDRFKYNLLAERINELGAILVAACRADPGFLSWPVREELEGAAAFLTGGQLDRTTVRPTLEPDGPLRDAVARGL